MRSNSTFMVLFIMLLMTAFLYVSNGQSEQAAGMQGQPATKILCLNHKVSSEFFDVSASPVYDWVHAGQQGINVTITNNTNEAIVIDWDKTLFLRRTAPILPSEDVKTPSIEAGAGQPFDVVPSGVAFSKTLWPRSGAGKGGILEGRSVFVSVRTDQGVERHEEIKLDVSGEQRVCSR